MASVSNGILVGTFPPQDTDTSPIIGRVINDVSGGDDIHIRLATASHPHGDPEATELVIQPYDYLNYWYDVIQGALPGGSVAKLAFGALGVAHVMVLKSFQVLVFPTFADPFNGTIAETLTFYELAYCEFLGLARPTVPGQHSIPIPEYAFAGRRILCFTNNALFTPVESFNIGSRYAATPPPVGGG